MSFGAGFASGIGAGLKLGGVLRSGIDQYKVSQIAAQGLDEAKAMREAQRDGMIEAGEPTAPAAPTTDAEAAAKPSDATTTTPSNAPETATPGASESASTQTPDDGRGSKNFITISQQQAASGGVDPQATASTTTTAAAKIAEDGKKATTPDIPATPYAQGVGQFKVGNQSYKTREEALAAADKATPPAENFLYKTQYPKLMQAYMEQGNTAKAEEMRNLMESQRGREATSQYAKGLTKLMTGDIDGGIKDIGGFYNTYVNDGVKWVGGEVTKNGMVSIRVQGPDGKETTTEMSRGQLARMAMAYNPAKLLEQNLLDVREAEKASASAASERAKEDRAFARDVAKVDRNYKQDVAKIDRRHEQDIEKLSITKQLDAANASDKVRSEVASKVRALKDAGFSEDFINGAMPGIIGIGDYKKATAPEEARRLAHSDRMKNDMRYARMTKEEQSKMLDQDMAIIYAGGKPTATPGAQRGSTSTPAAGGLTIYDTKTGQFVPMK